MIGFAGNDALKGHDAPIKQRHSSTLGVKTKSRCGFYHTGFLLLQVQSLLVSRQRHLLGVNLDVVNDEGVEVFACGQ